MSTLRILLLGAALLSIPAEARSQANVRKPSARCERSVAAVEQRLARDPQADWERVHLRTCPGPVMGQVLSRAVRRLRTSTDTALLRRYWEEAVVVDDEQLFSTALTIAGDRAASTPARVFGVLAVLRTVRPGAVAEYSNLVGGFVDDVGGPRVRGGCANVITSTPIRRVRGTPLGADFRERAARLRARLVGNASEPLDVRTAASCLPSGG